MPYLCGLWRLQTPITLIDKLREKILKGELKYGDKLPSSRTLAQDLGIARNTVISV